MNASTDKDYLIGASRMGGSGSLLRSTSKYLNSPLVRDLLCNEGLRRAGPDVINTALIPDFYDAFDPLRDEAEVAQDEGKGAVGHGWRSPGRVVGSLPVRAGRGG